MDQRRALIDLARHAPLDIGGDVAEQRSAMEAMLTSIPLPDDVTTTPAELGGVAAVNIDLKGADSALVILYFHGGAYALGSARAGAGLAADLARAAGARVISVDYRLAPENPFPAAVQDAVDAYRALLDQVPSSLIAIAGESAGGGLAAATLVALKDEGLPQPAAAVMFSPWADLTLSGPSMSGKAAADPSLTPAGMRVRAADYLAGANPATPLASPIFADLSGLPPLLIQAGSDEILLDDAVRLAARAAACDVDVTLRIVAGVPHVFQAFSALLDEAGTALQQAGDFLRAV
jgi:acetyl esterase/lipase